MVVVVPENKKAMSLEEELMTAMAGVSAACCAVPASKPTALVSITERRGTHDHTPMAGMAKPNASLTDGT